MPEVRLSANKSRTPIRERVGFERHNVEMGEMKKWLLLLL